MSLIELFIIAAGLSMDAFAVAICKRSLHAKMNWKHGAIVGLYFGGFQAGMPLIGYFLGSQFKNSIAAFDHWVAFVLLGAIGVNMIKESFSKEEEEACSVCSIDPKSMCLLAIATSIDALAVGVTFAFLQVQIIPAITLIGIITFVLSVLGVKAGNAFGTRYKSKAELAGGITLIIMGARILSEHLIGA